MQKPNQKEFKIEKVIKRKCDKLYVKWKGYKNFFNGWIDKKDSKNEGIFSKTKTFKSKYEDLSNYATKTDLKNATGVDTLDIAKKTDLTNLIYDVDKLYIDILKNIPRNLSNLKNKVHKLNFDKLETTPVY